jgi:AraC-like DNA-binding protein
MARQFGMNISAFSRYFKEKTGKTLVRYINEMRISYACKLLQENSQSISQVCFECGFNNLSNFNRFFKEKMGVTPSEYVSAFQ